MVSAREQAVWLFARLLSVPIKIKDHVTGTESPALEVLLQPGGAGFVKAVPSAHPARSDDK